MAIPLLDSLDIKDTDITADALLTQRKLADYLVDKRKAHFHFIVKANHASILDDLVLLFKDRKQPDFERLDPPDHGRIETRNIWTSTELNGYLDFPHVAQVFLIERIVVNKKPANLLVISPMALPAVLPNNPIPNAYSISTAVTGPSKTAATTSSIGTSTRTVAAFAPDTGPRERHTPAPLCYRSDQV